MAKTKMKITTKTGDTGITSLYGGKKVRKDDLLIETCGTLDEVMSFLELACLGAARKKPKKIIQDIQDALFLAGTELSSDRPMLKKLKKRIGSLHISFLEENIAVCEKKRKNTSSCFCSPANDLFSCTLDIARTLVRRLERRVVSLVYQKKRPHKKILIYLNRLSDLLYLLAREI